MAKKPIEVNAHVISVTRKDGKADAGVTLAVASSVASEIPLGAVTITITKLQDEMI